ncbi:MAG: efflux RND transporter permease subunit [Alphaproteobacteria bacterium]|nr:efflux RND transporter permease subunit [Alphaproteobacteria bacterium]
MLSDLSIKRPVFATVISLLLVVLGIAAYLRLPVREYPAIDPPIVSVTTVYRGASNNVIESRVTEIVEDAVAGLEGVKTITSSSREERSSVTVEFNLGRGVDAAAADVRDRVARVLARLPEGIDAPVVAKVDSDARAILWFVLTSDRRSSLELTDFAARFLVDRLSVVPGVASVIIGGERRYAMRIWLDRQALAARGLTVEDVEQAVRRQNVELPSGRLESAAREFTVKTDSRLASPREFERIVVQARQGFLVRLSEVARVELGPEDERGELRANGRSAIGLGMVRQSTANTLDVADSAKAVMGELREILPEGTKVDVGYDESVFISRSIYEVQHALVIGMALVIGVIFLFLRSVSATVVPAVVIPVSLIAAFSVMGALGFSVNVLTLLAFVLAIGIVVDDAIVVLENVHRHIEEGLPPLLATARGARQITFAVIAATLTLASVFVPISFMDGQTGRLFSEFGVSLAAAVVFSGLVALTLTPMMCSKLLRPHAGESRLVRVTEPAFQAINRGYRFLLAGALQAPLLVIAAAVAVSGGTYFLWRELPKEFTPVEDRGVIIAPITAPEGATMAYTREQVLAVERQLLKYVEDGEAYIVFALIAPGFQRPAPVNTGLIFVRLRPWDQRKKGQQQIAGEVVPRLLALPGARAMAVNPPSLGQRGFQQPVQMVLGGPDYETLLGWAERLQQRAQADGRFLNLDIDYKETKPELRLSIDRAKAADLGISVELIGRTLETLFGGREVGTFVDRGEEYKVIMQAGIEDRATPADLTNVFVRTGGASAGGQLVPLSNLVAVRNTAGPPLLNRVDRLRSVTLSASLVPGVALGDALDALERFAKQELPVEARISYQGQSQEYKASSNALYFTFGLALLVVFLVLAAQFESFVHPFIIMLSVPFAVAGGIGALALGGLSLNVYSQIGMILLIGIMTKNGILVVEFANQLRDQGLGIREAVLDAAVIRLRPILMTSISTAVGALPLALATGAGAESRSAIGYVVIGGVIVSTVMTGFVIPTLYLLLARFTQPINAIARRLAGLEREAGQPAAQAAE